MSHTYCLYLKRRIKIILKKVIIYFDFSSKAEDYIYTDANHMYKESGKVFTSQIADSILINSKHLK
jgi:hypothetical protein